MQMFNTIELAHTKTTNWYNSMRLNSLFHYDVGGVLFLCYIFLAIWGYLLTQSSDLAKFHK